MAAMGFLGDSRVPIPGTVYTDVLTFAFQGPEKYDEQRPLFIDGEDSTRTLKSWQFQILVRSLIAGLKAVDVG